MRSFDASSTRQRRPTRSLASERARKATKTALLVAVLAIAHQNAAAVASPTPRRGRPRPDLSSAPSLAYAPYLPSATSRASQHAIVMMPRNTRPVTYAYNKNSKLPPGIAERVSLQTAGAKQANQEAEIEELWFAMKKCYPSEADAVAAVTKNSAVILPQVNSPTKIKGTYALLCKRLGKGGAKDVITKNPGVLCCSPASLEKQSDADIVNAASLIDKLDQYKTPLKFVGGLFFFSIVASIVYRIITVQALPK